MAEIEIPLDEVETRDLPDRPKPRKLGNPSVVVDNLHITYKVFGGRPLSAANAQTRSVANRIARKGRQHVAAITEVPAVKGVSFVARHGESIGIVGTNGSGKSTLLRAVAGLIPPTHGQVFTSATPALLGVNAVLMRGLTGERNIMIGGLALGLSQKEIKERTEEVIDFAGIGEFAYLPMSAYSSGMGARLAFAISTFATPEILMIDEALTTGDSAFRERSRERIEHIRDSAGTVFLVSHSANTILSMCTRAIWMDNGKFVMDDTAENVCEAYEEYARTRTKAIRAGAQL